MSNLKLCSSIIGCTLKRSLCTSVNFSINKSVKNGEFAFIHNKTRWPLEILEKVNREIEVVDDFITETEENAFVVDTAVPLKRLRYEKDHWDNAIKLYREIEKKDWSPICADVINRVREYAFPKESRHLSYVHVLDLAKDGFIKPHIDSVRYCGDTIAGLSLLSDCIMRLAHKDDKNLIMDLLLKRRSLYVLRGIGRREFTHEVLDSENSFFNKISVPRDRRISIMCRSLPNPEDIT